MSHEPSRATVTQTREHAILTAAKRDGKTYTSALHILSTRPEIDAIAFDEAMDRVYGTEDAAATVTTSGATEPQAGTDRPAVDGAKLISTPPPEPDAILPQAVDRGDKVAIIGGAKSRKTFFLLNMALCLSSGMGFLCWELMRNFRVLFLNLEIRDAHFHRRLHRMATALKITPAHLGDRLAIRNLRGHKFDAVAVGEWAAEHRADVIIIDPLYRCHDGDENLAKDVKPILRAFDVLAEHCSATVIYTHHDAKGSPGDRDTRDRGAGSNVLARDYDAAFTLTEHQTEDDTLVVKALLRNYPPIDPFSITFHNGAFAESGAAPVAKSGTIRTSHWQQQVKDLCEREPTLSRRQAAKKLGCSTGIIQRYWYGDSDNA